MGGLSPLGLRTSGGGSYPLSRGGTDPPRLRDCLVVNRIRGKFLLFLLIVVAAAALVAPTTAAAGWTWDSPAGWTWDGTSGSSDGPATTVDLPG